MSSVWESYQKHIRQTLSLAWPVVLGQLGQILISMTDTAMVGRLPTEYLSAAALANSIFFLFAIIGIGMCIAITPLVAQAVGAERNDEPAKLLSQGIWVSLFTAGITWLLIIGSTFILPYLKQDPEVARLAVGFMHRLCFGLIPMFIFLAYKQYLEGMGKTVPGMLVMFFVLVVNVFFNWVLIYGKLGFPELKLNGSGWATFIARMVGMFLMILWVMKDKDSKKYRPSFRLGKINREYFMRIVKMGLPSGMQYFFEIGAFTCAVVLAGMISKEDQKAHQVAIMLAAFTYMVYLGISTAASIRVGNAFGSRRFSSLRKAGFSALFIGMGFIVISILSFIFLRFQLPLPFVSPEETKVYETAVSLVLIASFFQVADGLQCIALGALRGINDVKMPMVLTLCAYWVIGVPSGILLAFGFNLGVQGLWYGLSIGLGFSALFLNIRFVRQSQLDRIFHRPIK